MKKQQLIDELEQRAADAKSNAEYDAHDPQRVALHLREADTYERSAAFVQQYLDEPTPPPTDTTEQGQGIAEFIIITAAITAALYFAGTIAQTFALRLIP